MSVRRGTHAGRGAAGPEHRPADPGIAIQVTQPGGEAGLLAPGPPAPDAPRIHPTAIVEPGVTIGPRATIWDGVHVRAPSSIGHDSVIGEKTYVAHDVTIGEGVKINAHVYVCSGVTLEDRVMISAGVIFTNDRYPRAFNEHGDLAPSVPTPSALRTVVRTGATIGAGSLVGPGIDIGAFAMVGMGAVVTRDVLPHALVVGSPARIAGWVCVCGTPLGGAAVAAPAQCARCSRRYTVAYGPRGRVLSEL